MCSYPIVVLSNGASELATHKAPLCFGTPLIGVFNSPP